MSDPHPNGLERLFRAIPTHRSAVSTPLVIGDAERRNILRVLREKCTPQERSAIWALFGLDDGTPEPPERIAAKLGITQERALQIAAKGLRRLSWWARRQLAVRP